ncbi:MAG: MFS transporter [Sporichthyaceae bacterium]
MPQPQVVIEDPVQARVLRVLAAAQIFGGLAVGLSFAVASLEAARLADSDLVGGAAFTAASVGGAASAWTLARIADRAGRRPSLALGYGVGGLGTATGALAVGLEVWPLLLAGLVLLGAGLSAGMAARFAATDLAPPERRGRALSIVLWAGTVGAVLGPNLAVSARRAADGLGLPEASGPFVGCTIAFALAAAIVLVGLRPDPLLRAREQSPEPPAAHEASTRAVLAVAEARLALAGLAVFHLLMVGVMSMSPVHLNHGGHGVAVVGAVISVHIAGMYGLSPVFGFLADRFGPLRVLLLASGLMLAATVTAASSGDDEPVILAVALVLLGLGWSGGLVAGSVLLTNSLPVAERARAQGLADVAMNVSGALGGVAAGLVVAGAGFAFLGLSAWLVAAAYAVVVLTRTTAKV